MNKAHKTCPKCSTIFKHSTHFHRHVKRCGTTEHNLQCPYCLQIFTRKDNLKTHMKKKHPQSAPLPIQGFTCDKCQKVFVYEMPFNVHQKSCGKDKPKPFQCTFSGCGKSFTRKSTLDDHQKRLINREEA